MDIITAVTEASHTLVVWGFAAPFIACGILAWTYAMHIWLNK